MRVANMSGPWATPSTDRRGTVIALTAIELSDKGKPRVTGGRKADGSGRHRLMAGLPKKERAIAPLFVLGEEPFEGG
jgi:hypothetical protein